MGLPAHTLTEEDVIVIWTTLQAEKELAEIFGVSVEMIHKIKTGELFRQITKHIIGGHYDHTPNKGRFKAKLTEEQVLQVLRSEKSTSELAKEFNVSFAVIYDIRRGKTWRHLSYLNPTPHRQLRSTIIKGGTNIYRLVESDVHKIIQMLPTMSNKAIAQQYQVNPSTISAIRNGKNWKHITGGKKFPKVKEDLNVSH